MDLPVINVQRLQKNVTEVCNRGKVKNLDDIAMAVAQGNWAVEFDLDSETIRNLIEHHVISYTLPSPKVETEPEQIANVVATYTEGGKGRKGCPQCKKYVPAVSKRCPCGHVFERKVPIATAAKANVKEIIQETPELPDDGGNKPRRGKGATLTPAGPCPYKLLSTDIISVQEWGDKVINRYEQENRSFLSVNGLKYFAQRMFPYTTPEYKIVAAHLNQLYGADL